MKNFTGRLVPLLLCVPLLALAGCNLPFSSPSPSTNVSTVLPLSSGQECIIGEWELFNVADAVTSALPGGVSFQYAGTGGRMHWTFTAGGIAEAAALNFSLDFEDKSDLEKITIITNGTARRYYTLSGPGQIAFSNPDNSELTYAAQVAGVTVPLSPELLGLVPLMPEQGTVSYKCDGNSLSIIPPVVGVVPEELVRVTP
jgi:hypothetical protein